MPKVSTHYHVHAKVQEESSSSSSSSSSGSCTAIAQQHTNFKQVGLQQMLDDPDRDKNREPKVLNSGKDAFDKKNCSAEGPTVISKGEEQQEKAPERRRTSKRVRTI